MNTHPTDYFLHRGYRKLVLRLLLQTMSDLQMRPTSDENRKIIEDARAWVDDGADTPAIAGGPRQPGLTFADCFYVLGQASEVKRMREAALKDPYNFARGISQVLDGMNADEAVFADARDQNHGRTLTVGDFDTSWLFGGQPRDSLRGSYHG